MSRPLPSFSEAFESSLMSDLNKSEYESDSDNSNSNSCISSSSSDAADLEDLDQTHIEIKRKRKQVRGLNKTAQQMLLNIHKYFTEEKRIGADLLNKSKVLERTARAVGLTRQTFEICICL